MTLRRWLLVFICSVLLDCVWASCIVYITQRQSALASITSAIIILLSYGQFSNIFADKRYLTAACSGAAVGTWIITRGGYV